LENVAGTNGSNAPATEGWYYESLGQEWGPLTFEELLDHARNGHLTPDDKIRMGRKGKWRKAGSMGRLMALMPFQDAKVRTIGSETAEEDLEIKVPVRESPPPVGPAPAPTPPPAAVAPPPSPPLTPAMPAPTYTTFVPQVAPAWGGAQPMVSPAPVVDQGWYAWVGGVEYGPMEFTQLTSWGQTGRLTGQDYVKQGKYSQWSLANAIPGLIPAVPAPPPAPKPTPAPVAAAAPVPTPAAAAPSKPQPQLPPPTKPTPPRPSRNDTKPDYPPDAPPERPPSDWNTSSAMSSFGSSMASKSPAMNRPAYPPQRRVTPQKGRSKSSSGGGMDVGALLSDKRVWGALGAVVLVVGLYFGWTMLPEGSGKLVAAHKEFAKIYKEVEDQVGANPGEKEWADFGKKIKKKTGDITKTFSQSKHAARASLSGVASAINAAVNKKTPKEAEEKLKEAEKKLEDAKKKLKI
jgi:hypothetical protein